MPCTFGFSAASTPTLTAASPTTTTPGATLTLTGTGLVGGGGKQPTVTVCGGQACKVLSASAASVACKMPDCSAADATPIVLHVPPSGYASHPTSGALAVQGTIALHDVRLAVKSNESLALATGSAAGGVAIVLEGEGFDPAPSRMKVELVFESSVLATCAVTASSPITGELACTTASVADPVATAGTLCAVKVRAKPPTLALTFILTVTRPRP